MSDCVRKLSDGVRKLLDGIRKMLDVVRKVSDPGSHFVTLHYADLGDIQEGLGQGILFRPPCHRRWDAAEGSKMQFAVTRNLPPYF